MRVLIVDDQVRLTETAYDGNEAFRLAQNHAVATHTPHSPGFAMRKTMTTIALGLSLSACGGEDVTAELDEELQGHQDRPLIPVPCFGVRGHGISYSGT